VWLNPKNAMDGNALDQEAIENLPLHHDVFNSSPATKEFCAGADLPATLVFNHLYPLILPVVKKDVLPHGSVQTYFDIDGMLPFPVFKIINRIDKSFLF